MVEFPRGPPEPTQLPNLIRVLSLTTLLVFVALAATDFLQRALGFPSFLLLLPVVILATASWGAIPGIFAAVLTLLGMALLLEPRWIPLVASSRDASVVTTFAAVSFVSVWLASHHYSTREALLHSEAEFRALFELAAVGSAIVDPTMGRIMRVNEQFCSMTGYTQAELLAKTIAEITHPEDRQRDRETFAELMAGRRDRWSVDKRYLRKNGGIVWVMVSGTIVREAGEGAHLIAHAVDISTRRRAEEEAREVNRLKDEFLATLSHELRTPLNVALGWTHMLGKTADAHPPDVRRALPIIQRNIEGLKRLTDDLLGMSDVLTGRVVLQRRPLNVSWIVTDILESLSLAAAAKGLSLRADLTPDAVVSGDETRLRQVFWNLVSNALKFTPGGGTVSVTLTVDAQSVVVRVADTGIGITPSFLPHVFDKFRQEDATHTREHSGLGLGLAIARQFTELHGGTITVTSSGRDKGTVFTVTLPSGRVGANDVTTANRA